MCGAMVEASADAAPRRCAVAAAAAAYVSSGVAQPILMTVAKTAGLADPTCQLYMLFCVSES